MNVLVWMAAILFISMVLVGGKKGAKSFFALFLNFAVILLTILFMTDPNLNPIILTLIACIIIGLINLFYINDVNDKTTTAFLSTIITTIILLLLIFVVTDQAKIQGFGEEEMEELTSYSLYIGIDFVKLITSVIIISTIGAIIDVAMAISSPMREIYTHHPNISWRDLFLSGMGIGKDILGTSTNTLFFAFFGGYLALLIWFKDLSYSVGEIVNSKIFSAEIINILFAGIGVALNIPITAAITAYFLVRKRPKMRA